MLQTTIICPKCNGAMEEGELVDNNYAVSGAQDWAETAGSLLGLGITGKVRIRSFRCIECGYLENYAPSEKRKKELERSEERHQNKYVGKPTPRSLRIE